MKSFISGLFFVLSFVAVNAQWNINSTINTPVSLSFMDQQEVRLIDDANGGAILVWEDFRANLSFADIYVQRLNADGYPLWTLNGKGICTNLLDQRNAAICPALQGGAILAWQDFRNNNWDIFAQKIDSSGNILWTSNGVPVCVKALNQSDVKSVPDMNGGAYFVWVDSIGGFYDIYAQHLDASGNQLWPANGMAVCTALDKQTNPRIELDGKGGCIITWMDKRFGDYDIYAQRIDASGTIKWQVNGALVVTYPMNQSNPKIDPDGNGGAIISWQDMRNTADYDIYAQRIDSLGSLKWTNSGVPICALVGSSQSAVEICSKGGVSGAIIAWKDGRAGGGASQVYMQRINPNGQLKWQNNGVFIGNGINPNMCEDGNGGVIITWQDSTLGDWNVLSQHIDSSGNLLWTSTGVSVGNAAGSQSSPKNVPDGKGGSIFAFQDKRSLVDFDIYAHHLYSYGSAVGVQEYQGNFTMLSCFPNPVHKNGLLNFTSTFDVHKVAVFDLNGRMILQTQPEEKNSIKIPAGLENGVYFYQVTAFDGKTSFGRFIIE